MGWLENRLVYRPQRAEDWWADPPDPQVRDVWLTSPDGTRLHAWFLPHEAGAGAVRKPGHNRAGSAAIFSRKRA